MKKMIKRSSIGFLLVAVLIVSVLFLFVIQQGSTGEMTRAVSAGNSGIIVTFQKQSALQAKQVDLAGAPSWETELLPELPDNNYSLYSDNQEGAFIVWYDSGDSEQDSSAPQGALVCQRLSGDGKLVWGDSIRFASIREASIRTVKVVSDGNGGAIVAWNEYSSFRRNDEPVLRVNRIDTGGKLLWGNEGVILAASESRTPPLYTGVFDVVDDNRNGIYIVWQEQLGTNHYVTYGQHIDASGGFTWPENVIVAYNLLRSVENDGDGNALVQTVVRELTGAYNKPTVLTRLNAAGDITAEYRLTTGGTLFYDGTGGYYEVIKTYTAPPGVSMSEADVHLDMRHLDSDGTETWSISRIIDPGKNKYTDYSCFIDGEGGLFVVYQRMAPGHSPVGDIMILHVNATGEVSLNMPVFDVSGIRSMGKVNSFTDNAGGVIVVANMTTTLFPKTKIFVQNITPEGTMRLEEGLKVNQ